MLGTLILLFLSSAAAFDPACNPGTSQWSDGSFARPRTQHPLSLQSANVPVGHFTKTRQNNTICPSDYGEAQWTGEVTVGDGRSLFYWFFDSRNDPANDPIVIWLQGGPGASSTYGLFSEVGPCWLNPNTSETESNPWAWNNNASLLFIDQPAGTGFSFLADDQPLPYREEDTAEDFQQFLNIFFAQAFPEKGSLPIHIATESYGGHYGPVYLKHIITARAFNSRSAFTGNISSLILVSPLIEWSGIFVGSYEHLCKNRAEKGILNATACDDMARNLPEQERLGHSCQLAYTAGEECTAAQRRGDAIIHAAYKDLVNAGKRHPANIHKRCDTGLNYPQCPDPAQGNLTAFLNRPEIKQALGKPSSFEYEMINRRMFDTFGDYGSTWRPTTRELAFVLDSYHDKLADIKVLVLNGNDDFGMNTPGNMFVLDHLAWSGQPEYRISDWQPLPDGLAGTGSWKATSDGRLAFVAVDGAGHPVPGDVQEGSYRILQKWLHGEWK